MANTPDLETTLKAAQRLLDQRLTVVESHKRNLDAEEAARAALIEREHETARTWADLLAAGWSAEELGRLGFKAPAVKAPKRARRTRREEPAKATGSAPVVPPQASESPTPQHSAGV
ncbi:hypothetical protein [Streptomyces sp. NBC_01431]|uniref:hypothetical protein n=1 Tax=Streptomyces sp. NBC_01431 TaxID=2903863 RepID=UPI002E363C69|nr:hypothetical protein [Streptomyces sp. NBC_01431]